MNPSTPLDGLLPSELTYSNPDGSYRVEVERHEDFIIIRHYGFVDDVAMAGLKGLLGTVHEHLKRTRKSGGMLAVNNLTHCTGGTKQSKMEMKKIFQERFGDWTIYAVGASGVLRALGKVYGLLNPKLRLHFVATEREAVRAIRTALEREGALPSRTSQALAMPLDTRIAQLEQENKRLQGIISDRSRLLLELAGRVSWDEEYSPLSIALPEEDPFYDGFHAMAYMQNDIMEMVRGLTRAQRLAQSASEAKSRFLASMSHELRTPLNGIMGMLTLVLMTELTAEQAEHLQLAQFSAESLLKMVNALLDFSRIESQRVTLSCEEFSLRQLVTSIVTPLSEQAKKSTVRFELTITDKAPDLIWGDRVRTSQVVTNLVHNALKFTPSGRVSVLLDGGVGPTGEGVWELHVSDTGVGIAPEDHERIFSPFLQVDDTPSRSYTGMGLGLAITRELVQLMGGQVTLQSQKGEGATFTLVIPLRRKERC